MIEDKLVNGVNVKELFSTIDAIKGNPDIAKFRFRATNKWINGTHCRATIKDFYGALKEDDSRLRWSMTWMNLQFSSETMMAEILSSIFLSPSPAASPQALSLMASAKGIEINGVESRYEGDIDLRGFLGISEDVPVGYQNIRVYFKIDADISEEQKEELIRMAQKYSPVFNTITKSAPVSVHLDKESFKTESYAPKEAMRGQYKTDFGVC